MTRAVRLTLLWTAIGVVLVACVLALAWSALVPDDAEVMQQIVAQAEARLGVEVTVGSARLQLWPQPASVGAAVGKLFGGNDAASKPAPAR